MNGSRWHHPQAFAVGGVAILMAGLGFIGWTWNETRELAVANCEAGNDNKRALSIVLDEAVAVRRDVGDPAAEDFARAYGQIQREFLQPRECD